MATAYCFPDAESSDLKRVAGKKDRAERAVAHISRNFSAEVI